ncbi:hypothetical protein DESPIG_03064 [Desulfovibrio piger ATCC 29098]|uniref:Uncharacterized protein n=1 Tax=Desulfovibrio piger ATCC 29098 TaxID=411464 RepID=B6WY84_9BACT|nr:hypothetical protein DESPIG_03064 [Desulfovibrio piger ATCC 29098]
MPFVFHCTGCPLYAGTPEGPGGPSERLSQNGDRRCRSRRLP